MRSRLAIVCVATVVVATGCQSMSRVPEDWTEPLEANGQADENYPNFRQAPEKQCSKEVIIAPRHTYKCRLEWYEKTSVTAGVASLTALGALLQDDAALGVGYGLVLWLSKRVVEGRERDSWVKLCAINKAFADVEKAEEPNNKETAAIAADWLGVSRI